jgi:peptidoglycan/xylan/chitin deacetylase (PgdA/CDA1 family)
MVKKSLIIVLTSLILFFSWLGWYQLKMDKIAMKIALTFNIEEGSFSEYQEIIQLLKAYDQEGTFFIPGNWFENQAIQNSNAISFLKAALTNKIIDIGNFTYSMPYLTKLSLPKQAEEISKGKKTIESYLDYSPRYFRPPYLDYSKDTIELSEQLNQILMSVDLDALDWQTDKSTEEIFENITPDLSQNKVLVLRTNQNSVQVLTRLLNYFQKHNIKSKKLSFFNEQHHNTIVSNANTILRQNPQNTRTELTANFENSSKSNPNDLLIKCPSLLRDWSNYEHLALEIEGSKSQALIQILIKDAGGEIWKSGFIDEFAGNKTIYLTLKDFELANCDQNQAQCDHIFDYNFIREILISVPIGLENISWQEITLL